MHKSSVREASARQEPKRLLKFAGRKTTVAERASQNLRQGSSATKAPHSTVLSPSRQLSRGAGHSVKETLVKFGHPTDVRVVGKNHLVLQLLCNDVGREGRQATTPALIPHDPEVALELDSAVVVDRQVLEVQTTAVMLDDRRNGRLDVSRESTHRQTTRAANPRFGIEPVSASGTREKTQVCYQRLGLRPMFTINGTCLDEAPPTSFVRPADKFKRKMGLQPWYDSEKKKGPLK